MGFVAKHLPDKFYLEGDQRISLRTKIFREVVANLIVHREYTNAYPCSFVIGPAEVRTENANNPHGEGPIDMHNFAPFPKNPAIAKFFIQLGRVDELGSGVLNVHKYINAYAGGGKPQFIEGPVFKMIIPLAERVSGTVIGGVNDTTIEGVIEGVFEGVSEGVKDKLTKLLEAIAAKEGLRIPDYAAEIKEPVKSVERYMKQLREAGLVEFKGAPKTGGYVLSQELRDNLSDKKEDK